MKKIICILLILIICTTNHQYASAAQEETLLPSGTKATDIESTIDSYVKKYESTTAAVSVAVFTRDEVVLEKAYGYTNLENKTANDNESVFEWGSCSKLLIWVSVMQLAEQGKLDLNMDIRTYLPAGFLKKLEYDEPITLLNLLNHNAGWQEVVTDIFIKNKKDIKNLGDALKFTEPAQVFKPGEVVAYSNWGSALAAYIVECVSGQTYSEYVHANIFKPLGMEHTALNADLSDNEWVLEKRLKENCYTPGNNSLGTCLYYMSLYPAGMTTGTLSDIVKFAQAFVPVEGSTSPLFQNADTLINLLSPSLYYADKETPRICHGFFTDQFGVPVLWHNGGTVGSSSWFAFDQESGTGIVTLTNQTSEVVYTTGLLPLIFGQYKNTSQADTTSDISGYYLNSRSCFKGFAKLYSLLDNMEITKKDNITYAITGTDVTLSGISNNSFLMQTGSEKQYLVYSFTNEKGNPVLQLPSSDYIPTSISTLLLKYMLIALFFIIFIYCQVSLILAAVRWFRRKRKPFDNYRMALNASVIIAAGLCINIVTSILLTYSPQYQNIFRLLIFCMVMAVVPIAYIIILIVHWKKLDCTKRMKVNLVTNGIIGLVSSLNLFYWFI